MKTSFDIEKAIELVNKRSTTVETICKFIFEPIENYIAIRENYHMEEFKYEAMENPNSYSITNADDYVNQIALKIDKDVAKFVPEYVEQGIDSVLDAINSKKFNTKIGPKNLIILLTSLKENYAN